MQEFGTNNKPARRRMMVLALTALLVGSGGFAAAGGIEMVKGWFVTVQLTGPDGETREVALELGEEGVGEVIVDLEDGGQAVIEVKAPEAGGDGMTWINTTVTGGTSGTYTIQALPDGTVTEIASDE